jgi:crossover junction endodeoxyribonuclease RuvC
MAIIIGIDPGMTGGICIRDITNNEIELMVMPTKGTIAGLKMIDSEALAEMFIEIRSEIKCVYLEQIFAMSKQGSASMLSFGKGWGQILGVLHALNIPSYLVRPQEWQKYVLPKGKAGTTKLRALETAKKLFPQVELTATERSKNPHDGKVDALMISEFGVRHYKHRLDTSSLSIQSEA